MDNNNNNIERAIDANTRAIIAAFGSGAIRLMKFMNTATVSITTSSTALFPAVVVKVVGNKTVRIYINAANIIGSTPASDRIRIDILVDGVVVGRTYTGTANFSGRVIEADVTLSDGVHTITSFAIKDVGAGTVSFYADGAGATAYIAAEIVS